jgi:hypothetical protein
MPCNYRPGKNSTPLWDRENNTFPQTGHSQKYFIPSLFHITLNRKEKKLKEKKILP